MTLSRLASVTMALTLVGGLLGGHGIAAGRSSQQNAGDTARDVTAEQFDRWMADLSNWGRWGVEDELGTLNLITDAKRVEAAALVQAGITVSLSRRLVLPLARFHSRASRFRSSGENRIRRPIDPILRSNEISENTGTVQLSISGVWQHT